MRHDLKFEFPNGEKHETYSSMIMFGDDNATAMAKTVGLTAAIGANLVLEGHLDDRLGLASPMLKEVYGPALERLEEEGVNFLEKTTITK
jgi:alpha-aminoadipic semialdehyde synthase